MPTAFYHVTSHSSAVFAKLFQCDIIVHCNLCCDRSFSLNYVSVSGAASPSSAGHLNGGDVVAHSTAASPLPSNMVRNPYENVVIMAPGTVVHPQSPRTRIRTIAPSAKYVHC